MFKYKEDMFKNKGTIFIKFIIHYIRISNHLFNIYIYLMYTYLFNYLYIYNIYIIIYIFI